MAKFKFTEWIIDFFNKTEIFDFDWDDGNSEKNKDKHGIEISEIESLFYADIVFPLGEQYQPETTEIRYGIIAKSNTNRILFACFTMRENKIRAISVRLANKNERGLYE